MSQAEKMYDAGKSRGKNDPALGSNQRLAHRHCRRSVYLNHETLIMNVAVDASHKCCTWFSDNRAERDKRRNM
jgi:hypothetical protein